MDDQEYRALPELSASELKAFLYDHETWYLQYVEKSIKSKSSSSMKFGTLVHCLTLERKEYAARYNIKPPGLNLNSKEGRAYKETQAPKIVISLAEYQLALELSDLAIAELHKHNLLHGKCFKEYIIRTDQCKGKMDLLVETSDYVLNIDVKTCRSLYNLEETISLYYYDLSMSFYNKLIIQHFNKPVISYLLFLNKEEVGVKLMNIDHLIIPINTIDHYIDQWVNQRFGF